MTTHDQTRIDAIVFDLGNVFVWHDNAYLREKLAARASKPVDALGSAFEPTFWEDINRGRYPGTRLQRALCERLGVELARDEYLALWNCHFRVNDEMVRLAETLVGRVKLALLSNTNADHAGFLLPQLPVLERFDQVLLSHELGLVKPQPEIFQTALSRLGARAERTLFFDDLAPYVEAARAVGLHAELFVDTAGCARALERYGLSL